MVTVADAPPTTSTSSPQPTRPQQAQKKPTYGEVIAAIRSQTGCSRELAAQTIGFTRSFVKSARESGYGVIHPNEELQTPQYEVFDQLYPHGKAPTGVSAGDLLTRHLLRPDKGELSITHDMVKGRTCSYCAITVLVDVLL